jgi:hypothetical protein
MEAPLRLALETLEQSSPGSTSPLKLDVLEDHPIEADSVSSESSETHADADSAWGDADVVTGHSPGKITSAGCCFKPNWKLFEDSGLADQVGGQEQRCSLEATASATLSNNVSPSLVDVSVAQSSEGLLRSHLLARILFYLALSLYQQGTSGGILTGCLTELPDVGIGNRFFNPLRFWEPVRPLRGESRIRREQLLEAARLLAKAEPLLDALGQDSPPTNLVLADVVDGQGRCHVATGNAKRALQCHERAMALRLRHVPPDHLLIGHSRLNCGLALAAMQVRLHDQPRGVPWRALIIAGVCSGHQVY